jgi:hypothetical protein
MAITINGSGTIAGISVGGLENGCINEADLATAAVTNTKLASNAVTIDKLGTTEQSQLCKAWVNFNGTSTVAIRASYNVSSITDNGIGLYTVNFTTALADANYAIVATAAPTYNGSVVSTGNATTDDNVYLATTTACNFMVRGNGSSFTTYDPLAVSVAIFR